MGAADYLKSEAEEIIGSLVMENALLRAEVERLKTPEAIWRAYHALGDGNKHKLLGPWSSDLDEPCRIDVWGRRDCFVRLLPEGKWAGFLPEGYQFSDEASAESAMRRIDAMARERGRVLLGDTP